MKPITFSPHFRGQETRLDGGPRKQASASSEPGVSRSATEKSGIARVPHEPYCGPGSRSRTLGRPS